MANYIEIVRRFNERGKIYPTDELDNLIKTANGELYRSLYLYDETIKDHIQESGSIANYPGIVYPDRIVLDFDGDDDASGNNDISGTQSRALRNMRFVLVQLDDLSIYDGFNVFFSGRGFHIELDSRLFNFTPTPNLHKVVANTINKLFPEADNIFDKPRIYRCQNTINNKSKLYKIPLLVSEAQSLSLNEIKELAKSPRWDFEYDRTVVEPKLKEYVIYEKTPGSPPKPKSGPKGKSTGKFACIHNMYESTPEHGSRHDIIMRLVSHFKRQGYSKTMAFNLVKSWIGSQFDNNGRQEEVTRIIKEIYDDWDGYYTCEDPIMQRFCNSSCPYYKDIDIHDYDRMDTELTKRYEKKLFGFDLADIPEWKGLNPYRIEQNELVSIHGATGMGKSAFVQNLIIRARYQNKENEMTRLDTLYFSFEMPSYQVHRRNLQIVTGQDRKFVDRNYEHLRENYKKKLDHIKVHSEAIYANELPGIIEMINPQVIVLDHIGLMNSQYRDDYAKTSEITQTLRQVSIKYDVIIIMINQVSRENAKGQSLGIYAGKGSGSIENDSSKVISFERDSRTAKTIHLISTKDREGQSLNNIFNYNNQSLFIGGLT